MAADEVVSGTGPGDGPAQAIVRTAVEAARRRASLEVAGQGAPWTACAAPGHVLVVDRDGSLRACDYGACSLAGPAASWLDAWRADAFQWLRSELATGRLPLRHCRGCAAWVGDGLLAQAPLLRDYGELPPRASGSAPEALVLRLPGGELPAEWLDQVSALLPLTRLTIDSDVALSPGSPLFALLRAAAQRPALRLRLRHVGDADALAHALQGLTVESIELLLDEPDAAELAAARSLAATLAARLTARFVFGPQNWHEFEEVARACAAHGAELDLRVLDRDGEAPLAALDVEGLTLVKDIVASAWSRMGSPSRPASLAEGAFFGVTNELRKLLRRVTEEALNSMPAPERPSAELRLPPLDHAWFQDPERQDWWRLALFAQGHKAVVRNWLGAAVASKAGAAAVARQPWLRVLCQRIAWDCQVPGLSDVLRRTYAVPAARRDLCAGDRAVADQIDLRRFGGPWAARLGLDAAEPRQRPFAIGRPRKPKEGAPPPVVTVLIPSYRHADFIAETIRSVLAQRLTNFRLLVVDDCSPDETVARAEAIDDPRLQVHKNETNLGLGNSVLRALEKVDTPYVALLNSDDLFHPDRLGRCCAVLDQNAEVQLVTTGLSLVDARGGELTPQNASLVLDGRQVFDWVHWFARATPSTPLGADRLFEELLERNFLATSSNLVARTDWIRGQADALRSLKYCLDWQIFLDAALDRALFHVAEPLVAYRLHANNTVWFRDGRRWPFFLEVNRVLAEAIRLFILRHGKADDAAVERLLQAVAGHVAVNREADGFALFVSAVLDALQVDRAAAVSPRVQALLLSLSDAAVATLALKDNAAAPSNQNRRADAYRRLLGSLAQEQVALEHDRGDRLQVYVDSLEERVRDCWAARDQLEHQKQALHERAGEFEARVRNLTGEIRQVSEQRQVLQQSEQASRQQAEALDRRCKALTADLEVVRGEHAAIQELRTRLAADLEAVRGELEAVRADTAARAKQLEGALAVAKAESAALRAERDQLAADLGAATQSIERLQLDLAAAHESATTRARVHQEAITGLEKQRSELVTETARLRAELEKLASSREFRIGNFLWNKLPLSSMSRLGKKWYLQLFDAKDRMALWAGSKLHRHKAEGVAVVASCWHWPIYSHTFVYQEMLGLTHMGLDVKMFHWDVNDADQMQPAFAYLAEHRVHLKPVWENHKKDMEHFAQTKPGRLQSLLVRIAALTGRTVEDLEKEPHVLRACTFARMAELANANYLHTYFFYDQSFMAMVAAWLLEIPRGISCYADHMLDDHPLKLVPLHVELASVVVATSARIKRELSEKSGGRFDDKIIVKPNGIDGVRFPVVDRGVRQPTDLFEVLSVSRIEPKKGLVHLVEAVADLKQRGHNFKAHVIGAHDPHSPGSLDYAQLLERRIAELGVTEEVVMHGMMMQEEILPILGRSRAFVAPYVELTSGDKDGIPTAMLEALASALPVVTTNAGSISEVVDHGVEALVVPQNDSKALADALDRLIREPALERKLAKAARARFDRQFDITVTERALHKRIADLLAVPTPR